GPLGGSAAARTNGAAAMARSANVLERIGSAFANSLVARRLGRCGRPGGRRTVGPGIAVGPRPVAPRLGRDIEAGDGVGVGGIERRSRNIVRQELDERQLVLLDSLDDALGQLVAAIVRV